MSIKIIPGSNKIESTDGTVQLVGSAGNQPTMVQQVFVQNGAVATASANTYTSNDTIPQQSTATNIFLTLSITPLNASNILIVDAVGNFTHTASDIVVGLWRDSIEDALGVMWDTPESNDFVVTPIRIRVTAGSTSTTTFKLGASGTSGTVTFNGVGGLARFGGTLASTIMITELTP